MNKHNKKSIINTIQNIDCLEGIKKIPDGKVDLIFTDPPYGLNKAGIKNDENLEVFYKILPECYRVLKDDAFFITFFSTKFLPDVFKNNPFTYYWNFVLYCPNGRVSSSIGFTKYMSCIVFKKGNAKIVKKGKDIFVDTPGRMIEPDEGFIDHPTPKPKTFIKDILQMFSKENDIVLDPFIGSGSLAVACKQTKRRYVGFEIDKNYYKLANTRLKKF
ncbi:MAG: site-specific DNA-methyltransferase [Candidatus Nomurabacteria bacterium]